MPIDELISKKLRSNDKSILQLDLTDQFLTNADLMKLREDLESNTTLQSLMLKGNFIEAALTKFNNAMQQRQPGFKCTINGETRVCGSGAPLLMKALNLKDALTYLNDANLQCINIDIDLRNEPIDCLIEREAFVSVIEKIVASSRTTYFHLALYLPDVDVSRVNPKTVESYVGMLGRLGALGEFGELGKLSILEKRFWFFGGQREITHFSLQLHLPDVDVRHVEPKAIASYLNGLGALGEFGELGKLSRFTGGLDERNALTYFSLQLHLPDVDVSRVDPKTVGHYLDRIGRLGGIGRLGELAVKKNALTHFSLQLHLPNVDVSRVNPKTVESYFNALGGLGMLGELGELNALTYFSLELKLPNYFDASETEALLTFEKTMEILDTTLAEKLPNDITHEHKIVFRNRGTTPQPKKSPQSSTEKPIFFSQEPTASRPSNEDTFKMLRISAQSKLDDLDLTLLLRPDRVFVFACFASLERDLSDQEVNAVKAALEDNDNSDELRMSIKKKTIFHDAPIDFRKKYHQGIDMLVKLEESRANLQKKIDNDANLHVEIGLRKLGLK